MGLTVWLFLRHAVGTFQPFPTARYGQFHDGQEPLQTLAGQEVRFAEVVVELKQRRATRVCRVVWPKHRLNAAGQWDPQSRQAGIRAAMESLGTPSGQDVLAGKAPLSMDHLLAEIRYSTEHLWDPAGSNPQRDSMAFGRWKLAGFFTWFRLSSGHVLWRFQGSVTLAGFV